MSKEIENDKNNKYIINENGFLEFSENLIINNQYVLRKPFKIDDLEIENGKGRYGSVFCIYDKFRLLFFCFGFIVYLKRVTPAVRRVHVAVCVSAMRAGTGGRRGRGIIPRPDTPFRRPSSLPPAR